MLTNMVSFGSAGPTRAAPLRTCRELPTNSRNPGLLGIGLSQSALCNLADGALSDGCPRPRRTGGKGPRSGKRSELTGTVTVDISPSEKTCDLFHTFRIYFARPAFESV